MATFVQLKTRAKQMAVTSDDTEAGLIVNDVYRDVVVQSQTLCDTTTINLTGGANVTTLNISDLGMIQYITYRALGQTQSYIIEPSSIEEVIQLAAVNPSGVVRKYALQGLFDLYLWPTPQTTGDELTIYYAATPKTLVNSAPGPGEETTPSAIPAQWHHLLSVGAAARLADAVGEDLELGIALQAKYDQIFSRFTGWLNMRHGRGTQRMSSGYVRNVGLPPHDRSTYFSGQYES